MHSLRKYIRVVSAFLLINFLFSTFLPTISYALTAGPTAPEATSFEPIDTTDMVNLQTGDFTYNIPLLEVPGPSGGYPLSLSYHAGIMPSEEASWVGLGWTLNPGAINRTVNGFADDHKDVTNTNRFFWKGGERKTVEVGVSAGIAGVAGPTAGLSVGHDTYQGFGVGAFISAGIGIGGKNSPLGVSGQLGVDSWGNAYASAGLSVGTGDTQTEGLRLSGSVGLSTNFKSVSGYTGAGVSYSGGDNKGSSNLMGASISTSSGGAASLSIAGASSTGNSKTGKISTSGISFTLPIPYIHLGFKNQRYWIDETENTATYGALHYPTTNQTDWHYYDDKALDTYTLLDTEEAGGIVENPDPEKVLGGSFPSYDHYNINAQGISGNIQPYIFQGYLHRQNAKEGDNYNTIHYSTGVHSKQLGFRFVGEFSNRYLYEPPNFESGSDLLNFDFDNATQELTGDGVIDGMNEGKLAGSKDIEYLTNIEIKNKSTRIDEIGFMDTRSTGFSRLPYSQSNNDQIGAYVVTNESGVKYHFSLPVYASEEYQYSKNIEGTKTFNEIKKPKKYAYTWLLTGITGPDFVDRGTIGEFDEEDWGYWVEFDYGKWTEDYVWRNPDLGTHKDLDTNFENFSTGIKEVYYLDQIKTKTHTAVFVKDIRDDAKSAIRHFKNKFGTPTTDDEKEGSYIPKNISTVVSFEVFEGSISENTLSLPVSSLKLKDIYLFKNDALASLDKSAGDRFHQQMTYDWSLVLNGSSGDRVVDQHLPDHVLDVSDLDQNFADKAIRVVSMENTTDPEEGALCPETVNSFASSLVPSSVVTNYPTQGKLTLQSVSFKGKAGADLIPPMKFEYEPEEKVSGYTTLRVEEDQIYFHQASSGLEKGDLIKFNDYAKEYYGLVESITNDWHYLKIIGKNQPSDLYNINWSTTKNPPYNAEKRDIWGMYKPDYEKFSIENIDRMTTLVSSQSNDAWSLHSVTTSLGSGIKVNYGCDKYSNSIKNISSLPIKSIEKYDEGNFELEVGLYDQRDLKKISALRIGETINLVGAYRYYGKNNLFACDGDWHDGVFTWVNVDVNAEVREIYSNKFIVSSEELYNQADRIYGYDRYFNKETAKIEGPPVSNGSGWDFDEYGMFIGGEVFLPKGSLNYIGGGINVSSISIESDGEKSTTKYQYKEGVTSIEPFSLEVPLMQLYKPSPNPCFTDWENDAIDEYKDLSYGRNFENCIDLLANSREIPPPGVVYKNVIVQESYTDSEGNESYLPTYTTYEFQTFEDYMVDIYPEPLGEEDVTPEWSSDVTSFTNKVKKRKITIRDLTAQVGALKSITRYEDVNHDGDSSNDRMIAKTINHDIYDGYRSWFENEDDVPFNPDADPYERLSEELESRFKSQGMVHESYVDARYVRQEDDYITVTQHVSGFDLDHDVNPYHLLGVISKKERFPLIHTGQTNINYKTGITTSTTNLGFDFYSGAVTKTISTDSHGNIFLSETIPAYRKYNGMGLAIHGGYNMLTQEAANYVFKVSNKIDLAKEALVSANIQTWDDKINNLSENHFNTSIGERYDYNNSEEIFILNAVEDWFDEGQSVLFKTGGQTYQVRLGSWYSTFAGFGVLNIEEIDLDLSSDVSGTASYWHSDTWRKHKAYTYASNLQNQKTDMDGLVVFDPDSFEDFDNWYASAGEPSSVWQKNSEITLYDRYSHALEATDVNGNFAATKMDSKHEKVLATVANASYEEFAYSGAEDEVVNSNFGGTVSQGEATIYTASDGEDAYVHTGDASLSVDSGGKAFSFSATPTQLRNMKVSVWSSQSDGLIKYKVNDGAEQTLSPKVRQADSWYLLSAYIPAVNTGDELEVWCEAGSSSTYFDDFRVHPIDAPMTAYVYNDYDELTFILDNNNLFTEYKYDEMGRLKEVHRESFKYGVKKTSETNINYAGSY